MPKKSIKLNSTILPLLLLVMVGAGVYGVTKSDAVGQSLKEAVLSEKNSNESKSEKGNTANAESNASVPQLKLDPETIREMERRVNEEQKRLDMLEAEKNKGVQTENTERVKEQVRENIVPVPGESSPEASGSAGNKNMIYNTGDESGIRIMVKEANQNSNGTAAMERVKVKIQESLVNQGLADQVQSVILEEVANGSEVEYKAIAEKSVNLLGIYKFSIPVEMTIDETGENVSYSLTAKLLQIFGL